MRDPLPPLMVSNRVRCTKVASTHRWGVGRSGSCRGYTRRGTRTTPGTLRTWRTGTAAQAFQRASSGKVKTVTLIHDGVDFSSAAARYEEYIVLRERRI